MRYNVGGLDEIVQTTIKDFGDAAARVKEAGFDAVQVHGAIKRLGEVFKSLI